MVVIKRKRKNFSPFGSSVKRFDCKGMHPMMNKYSLAPIGPGRYDPKPLPCGHPDKPIASSWQRKQEVEEFSRYLGYRNPALLDEREFWKTMGGPGIYDISDDRGDKGRTFPKSKRFRSPRDAPPVGCHNVKRQRTDFSSLPSFEWDGFTKRFKDTEPNYRRPPNLYEVWAPQITDRVVTKRGPYDCFTGPRDETTIKNHFAQFALPRTLDIFYDVPNQLDWLLADPVKRRCGKFLKEERFFPDKRVRVDKGLSSMIKDQTIPGPDQYDVDNYTIKQLPENAVPFNSSTFTRGSLDFRIHPGPERYKVKEVSCLQPKRQSWMFKSSTLRELPIATSPYSYMSKD